MILKKLEVRSRAEIRNTMSVGHDIDSESDYSKPTQKTDKSGLSDISLYWPSAHGLTVVDHLVKDVNFEDE
jgi:hypothetical protein